MQGRLIGSLVFPAVLAAFMATPVSSLLAESQFKAVAGGIDMPIGAVGGSITSEQPLEQLSAEPKYASGNPLYLVFALGDDLDSLVSGAMDESGGTLAGYDSLYIDRDNDGDLGEEPRIALSKSKLRTALLESAPFDVTIKYFDGNQRSMQAVVYILPAPASKSGKPRFNYRLAWNQHLEGMVRVGDSQVLAAIYDSPSDNNQPNGCFNDPFTDTVVVDADRNGKLEGDDKTVIGGLFMMDNRFWSVSSDSSALNVTAAQSEQAAGRIRWTSTFDCPTISQSIIIYAEQRGNAQFSRQVKPGENALVPSGGYYVKSDKISATDAGGTNWSIVLRCDKKFKVEPNAETELKFGPPLSMKVSYRGRAAAGGALSIEAPVTGVGGEQYSYVSSGKRLLAPKVTILDAGDKVVSSGNMEYG